MRFRYFRDWLMGSESWWRRAWLVTLQYFTVLPMEIFRRCVISSLSVIYLPTSSPTDYVRRFSLRRWFPIPSLYQSETQKNHLPMVLKTEFARQKKKDSRLKYIDGFLVRRYIVIYRRKLYVGKSVGECMKYRHNMSVGKVVGYCGSYC
jgi:DNA-binding transcriptional LysR family regulator